ncbi:MAG: DegV family protein [Blautia sp.]|nr:DegV family protein [Blautia sp.]
MSYKIVVDSCCELPKELLDDPRFVRVPLGIEVGDYRILDDDDFNQKEFLKKVAESPECPRSSCPSPELFMEAYCGEADHVYAVTLSSHLSGSYNSAKLGMELYQEKYGDKQIHVIDSESASGAETQLALKLVELEEAGLPFEEIVKQIEKYRDSVHTYFVLDNLDTFIKNGRISGIKALAVTSLNIRPVLIGVKGKIEQKSQSIGTRKALIKMAEFAAAEVEKPEERRLIITHCNELSRAEMVKNIILAKRKFKECVVMDMRGISSMYANDGGVIVTT